MNTSREQHDLYHPLASNQTRIIHLLPADDAANLTVELRTLDLSKPEDYVAISYTWGAQPLDHTVICDGKPLQVTKSCHEVLHFMRSRGWQMIWIDQLCVDQNSLEERSKQVQLMSQIYRQAVLVLAWLGPPGQRYKKGLDAVADVRDSEAANIIRSHLVQTLGRVLSEYDSALQLLFNNKKGQEAGRQATLSTWDTLLDFLSVPYWQRRWILQEILLNEHVVFYYGSERFYWQDLWQLMIVTIPNALNSPMEGTNKEYFSGVLGEEEFLIPLKCLEGMVYEHHRRQLGPVSSSLEDALVRASFTKVTVELDYFYAIRGLIDDDSLPAPNYKLPFEEVYLSYMNKIFAAVPVFLQWSGLCQWPLKTQLRIPSWFLNVTADYALRPIEIGFGGPDHPRLLELTGRMQQRREGRDNLEAGGERLPQLTISKSTTRPELSVKGAIIDTIVAMKMWLPSHLRGNVYASLLWQGREDVSTSLGAYQNLVDWASKNCSHDWCTPDTVAWLHQIRAKSDIDAWTSYAESNAEDTGEERFSTRHAALDLFLRSLCQGRHLPELKDLFRLGFEGSPLPPILTHAVNALTTQAVAVTKQGFLGFVPTIAQVGDSLAIFRGIHSPMAIRQAPDASDRYQVVGASWFLGLGAGQGLLMDEYKETDVVLI